jgi:hypothetical protein
MKNQLTNRMPEDTCSREVVGGSLWTGESLRAFYFLTLCRIHSPCYGFDRMLRLQIKQAAPIAALPSTTGTALTITPEGRHNGKIFNNNTYGIRARKKNRGFAQMTKKLIFIGLSLILVFCSSVYAESANYCHDEKSWKEWDALVEKNPNDMEVQTLHALRMTLHALRIGLCAKVDRGGITLDQATEIFESAREAIIQKRKEDQKREQDRQKL